MNENGLIVGNRYELVRRIGCGTFGEIYLAKDTSSGERVAVKLEASDASHPQLGNELNVLRTLVGGCGIPQVMWYGHEGDFYVLVMELLGPSLEDLFNFCRRKFSLKTVLLLVEGILPLIEFLHSRGLIHRDIKPDNFLMGLGNKRNTVHMIDYGLTKKYCFGPWAAHIPYKLNKQLSGTARYASVNNHLGVEQSRRDDLESVAYMLIYFVRGGLPWEGLQASTRKSKYEAILRMKSETSLQSLCTGFPDVFMHFLVYCKQLEFDERPNYEAWRENFRDVFQQYGFADDCMYDWCAFDDARIFSDSN
ncbi:hypothetical protein AB6A40_003822 [Gnathostoma spinigerum]|uniref:non-specific serine/threonine protein kinase n=1 Tax=Gnathostoma spinigerum TaxID=75299 RepID=A0ABD6EJG3_9BILA